MTALVILGSILLLAIAAVAIAWPLLREQDQEADDSTATPETVAVADPMLELYERRDSIYQAIQELRFDYEVGKVSEADYAAFDSQLKMQAVAVLQEIDSLEAAAIDSDLDARLEAEIAALRHVNGQEPVIPPPAATVQDAPSRYCPQCGTPVRPGDRFCGRCGATVSREAVTA